MKYRIILACGYLTITTLLAISAVAENEVVQLPPGTIVTPLESASGLGVSGK